MNEDNTKEVYFDQYCQHCKHKNVEETEDPCNECLTEGGRLYSHKPENFEEVS